MIFKEKSIVFARVLILHLSRDNFQIGRLKLTTNASFFFKIRYQFLLFLYEEDIAVKKNGPSSFEQNIRMVIIIYRFKNGVRSSLLHGLRTLGLFS